HERNDFVLRKVSGALESHVLDQVRQPLLVLIFENRSGVDYQAQLGTLFRSFVRANVIAEAVTEFADGYLRIDRHRVAQRLSLRERRAHTGKQRRQNDGGG